MKYNLPYKLYNTEGVYTLRKCDYDKRMWYRKTPYKLILKYENMCYGCILGQVTDTNLNKLFKAFLLENNSYLFKYESKHYYHY